MGEIGDVGDALLFEDVDEFVDVTVEVAVLKIVVQGECAALFQDAQCLDDKHEFVLLGAHFVKDEVADDGVEGLVGRIECCCVTLHEGASVAYVFEGRVAHTLLRAAVPHRRPEVDPDDMCLRILLCKGDAECPRAASDVEDGAASIPWKSVDQCAVDAPYESAAVRGEDMAAVGHVEGGKEGHEGEDEENAVGGVPSDQECTEDCRKDECGGDAPEGAHHRARNPVAVVRFHDVPPHGVRRLPRPLRRLRRRAVHAVWARRRPPLPRRCAGAHTRAAAMWMGHTRCA